jgi:tyrosyl-tRNA synthetase
LALVGGATGLIGDPSFKTAERKLNSDDVVTAWVGKLQTQVSQFIEFGEQANTAKVINNLDWTANVSVIDFMRNVGKHFSVNAMIKKESVKQRIDRDESGISFTEFSYMLLQSFDFAELSDKENTTLQIGGSDQWGNITGGIDLARRMYGNKVYGLTMPLVTKSDGTKFGKTETGTIWLDPKRTSPYAFFQFWINTADADVYSFLRYFTFLPVTQIIAIEERDKVAQGRPEAQGILADEVTRLVHGEEGLVSSKRITQALFSGDLASLSESDLEQLAQDGLPSHALTQSEAGLVELLTASELAKSNKMAREFFSTGAVSVNGKIVTDPMASFSASAALHGKYTLIKRGKKLFSLMIWGQ